MGNLPSWAARRRERGSGRESERLTFARDLVCEVVDEGIGRCGVGFLLLEDDHVRSEVGHGERSQTLKLRFLRSFFGRPACLPATARRSGLDRVGTRRGASAIRWRSRECCSLRRRLRFSGESSATTLRGISPSSPSASSVSLVVPSHPFPRRFAPSRALPTEPLVRQQQKKQFSPLSRLSRLPTHLASPRSASARRQRKRSARGVTGNPAEKITTRGQLADSLRSITAYATNPTAATFRTHLTSLSFHTHLRRLSSSSLPPSKPHHPTETTSPPPNLKQTAGHVLSFSNRISLSVKTPPYCLRSYFFFSTVVMAPPPVSPRSFSSHKNGRITKDENVIEEGVDPDFDEEAEVGGLWIGAFGRWYAWNLGGEESEEDDRRERLAKGILAIEVENDDKGTLAATLFSMLSLTCKADIDLDTASSVTSNSPENEPTSPVSPAAHTSSPRLSRTTKRIVRQGQRRPSPTSLARLRSKAESSAAASASALPPPVLIPPPSPHADEDDGFYTTRSPKDRDSPGLPFHVARTPPIPGHFPSDTAPSSPIALRIEPTDPVLEELKTQVEELRNASEESERRLLNELETLREKRKEEDVFRAELKGKTKVLEEQKRLAELNRVEAERELGERKAILRRVGERVERIKDEIVVIDRREVEMVERKEKKKRDRKERERKLREDVSRKKEELRNIQGSVEKIKTKTVGLGRTIESRREVLMAKRSDMAARGMGPDAMMSDPYYRTVPFHPGMTTSRPGSIRSGFSHERHSSAPTSPTLPYSHLFNDESAGPYPPASSPFLRPTNSTGFLEHRIQHRRTDQSPQYSGDTTPFVPQDTLPSVDDFSSKFLPFDFDFDTPSPLEPISNAAAPSSEPISISRPPLSLPLQYLESGLLAADGAEDNDESQGTYSLSPMTPHQASLIPSQLFHLMDDDDQDNLDLLVDLPESPSLGRSTLELEGESTWIGLGMESMDRDCTAGGMVGGWDSEHFPGLGGRQLPSTDDLPRQGQGLSLNPGAKSFSYSTLAGRPNIASSTGTISPPPGLHRHSSYGHVSRGSTASPSTTSATTIFPLLDPPAKSRMDFAVPSLSSASTGITTNFASAFDWQRPSISPRLSSGPPPSSTALKSAFNSPTIGARTNGAASAFNPFGDDDEKLSSGSKLRNWEG